MREVNVNVEESDSEKEIKVSALRKSEQNYDKAGDEPEYKCWNPDQIDHSIYDCPSETMRRAKSNLVN